jgi:hypothetical protein
MASPGLAWKALTNLNRFAALGDLGVKISVLSVPLWLIMKPYV